MSYLVTACFWLFLGHIFGLPWATKAEKSMDIEKAVFLSKDNKGRKIVIQRHRLGARPTASTVCWPA